MKPEVAAKAAKWWADRLRGNARLDNGDQSSQGGMVLAMATILQDTEKSEQSPEQIDRFEAELAAMLEKRDSDRHFYIGVDYHPDRLLCDAAQRADLKLGMTTLPWKTSMWIVGDEIKVAEGYGAEAVVL